jgi:hypothetical protein
MGGRMINGVETRLLNAFEYRAAALLPKKRAAFRSKRVMGILHAHSFLVHPGKNDQVQLEIGGVAVRPGNRVFQMLSAMYDSSRKECDVEIVFRSAGGRQENARRGLFLKYVEQPSMENGRAIAEQLQRVTTHRSGLGLLFLAVGDDNKKIFMISRFPADQGVVAQEQRQKLEVSFIERIFMKNARAYKSAVYPGPATEHGLWKGYAIDKQLNDIRELSNYWIGDFLDSEMATTGPSGTRRMAVAVREAIRNATDSGVRGKVIAAAQLMSSYDGRVVTARKLGQGLGLGEAAMQTLEDAMPRRELFDQKFKFDATEFEKLVQYRSITLDNGAVLTADNTRFNDVFSRQPARDGTAATYSTTGTVVAEKLRKTI